MSLLEFMGEHPVLTFMLLWLTYEFISAMTKHICGSKQDGEK